jgi:hypothetical protein
MVSGVTIIRADKGLDGDYAIALALGLGCADRQAQERMPRARPPPVALSPAAARARRSPPFLRGDEPTVGRPRRICYRSRRTERNSGCGIALWSPTKALIARIRMRFRRRGSRKRIVASDGSLRPQRRPQPDGTTRSIRARPCDAASQPRRTTPVGLRASRYHRSSNQSCGGAMRTP